MRSRRAGHASSGGLLGERSRPLPRRGRPPLRRGRSPAWRCGLRARPLRLANRRRALAARRAVVKRGELEPCLDAVRCEPRLLIGELAGREPREVLALLAAHRREPYLQRSDAPLQRSHPRGELTGVRGDAPARALDANPALLSLVQGEIEVLERAPLAPHARVERSEEHTSE